MDRVDWEKIKEDLNGIKDLHGFELFEPGGERHGSWVWTWSKKEQEITRYVSLALTEEPASYLVEITAGADDSKHFHRLVVATFCYRDSEMLQKSLEALQKKLNTELVRAFNKAVEYAQALQHRDLLSPYPRAPFQPRSRQKYIS